VGPWKVADLLFLHVSFYILSGVNLYIA
jgi:hypothetical protein